MNRPRSFFILLTFASFFLASSVGAQIVEETSTYQRLGDTFVTNYRVGATISATRGPVQNIKAMVAIPFECAEQKVKIVEEDITQHCDQVEYRMLREGGAKQLLISIPFLPAGEEARAIVTFEVQTSTLLPPEDTSDLVIPVRPNKKLKRYLGRSPYIETKPFQNQKGLS